MTIEQIATRLDDCANQNNCKTCEFGYGLPTKECQTKMIEEMGNECRKIAERIKENV